MADDASSSSSLMLLADDAIVKYALCFRQGLTSLIQAFTFINGIALVLWGIRWSILLWL